MALTEDQKVLLEQEKPGILSSFRRRGRPQKTNPPENENTSFSGDTAPKTRGRAAATKTEIERIRVNLTGALNGVSATVSLFNAEDAAIIQLGAPNLVSAVCELCEQDKDARKLFSGLLTGGAYMNVGAALFSIILPILLNHGLVTGLFFNTPKARSNGVEKN